MKIIRKLFLLTAVVLLIWGGVYSYNQITDGFSIRQIRSSLPPYPQYEVPLSEEQKTTLQAVLSQPYHYIGKGTQCYVFESKDGKYVLKFLKHKHLRSFTWLNHLPLPTKLRAVCDAKIKRRQARVETLFSGFKLAYEELCEETGLLYIHLNRIPALESEVVIIDRLGLKHHVELDQYEYIVQKRAILVKDAFEAAESEQELRSRIEQLIAAVVMRCEKGIADHDRSFVQNIAFSAEESRAIFIDSGKFYKNDQVCTDEGKKLDIQKRLADLHYWTGRYFPEYVSVVEEYLR